MIDLNAVMLIGHRTFTQSAIAGDVTLWNDDAIVACR